MTWGGPQSLGGVLNTAFSPSAVSWGPGRVDVFAVGLDLQLLHWWHNTRYGRHHPPQVPWSGPEALGGTMASNPMAVSWGPGRLDIFWIDAGTGQLATNSWEEGWTGPRLLGGSLLPQFYTSLTAAQSPPLTPTPASVSGVSLGPGLLDVFASYSDDTVAHWSLSNGWQENLPNTLALPREVTSAPSVVSWGPNRMDVFVNAQGGLAWWWWDNQGPAGAVGAVLEQFPVFQITTAKVLQMPCHGALAIWTSSVRAGQKEYPPLSSCTFGTTMVGTGQCRAAERWFPRPVLCHGEPAVWTFFQPWQLRAASSNIGGGTMVQMDQPAAGRARRYLRLFHRPTECGFVRARYSGRIWDRCQCFSA